MVETTLTLKFRGVEANLLNEMTESGLFNSKSEAIRAALVHYSVELGLLQREKLWKKILATPPRQISPKQLAKELETLKDEV